MKINTFAENKARENAIFFSVLPDARICFKFVKEEQRVNRFFTIENSKPTSIHGCKHAKSGQTKIIYVLKCNLQN